MKIKIKKEYDDVFEAMKDITDRLIKDGEINLEELVDDIEEIEIDFSNEVEFDVLVKDDDLSKRKSEHKT